MCLVCCHTNQLTAHRVVSVGSVIGAELDDSGEFLDKNQTVADPIDRQQPAPGGDDWMNRMSDSWKFDNFHRRRAATRFNGAIGPSVLHPPEASPLLYFLLFWTEEMWKDIVDKTKTVKSVTILC